MKKLPLTLEIINKILDEKITYLFVRHLRTTQPDDLDILVKADDFEKVVDLFKKSGWEASSHDQALGGRKKGFQINLTKPGFIKIDLHKDFTWRKIFYMRSTLLWENKKINNITNVSYYSPPITLDAFLVFINHIFEKTYFEKNDWEYLRANAKEVFNNKDCKNQAKIYGWGRTYHYFQNWFNKQPSKFTKITFIPIWLVIFSYIEKLIHDKYIDLVSLLYYLFFRARYFVNKTLPYS